MTEDEAKTKWCPMVRYRSVNGEGINRWVSADDAQLSPDPSKCLGSGCMMWREHPWANLNGQRVDRGHYAFEQATPHGFCGLAGPVV